MLNMFGAFCGGVVGATSTALISGLAVGDPAQACIVLGIAAAIVVGVCIALGDW